MRSQGFGVLIHQVRIGALRTSPSHRFIPGNKLALRVFVATIKYSAPGTPGNHFPAATQRTFDSQGNRHGGFAFRVFGAGQEFPEASHLNHHVGSAFGAFFVRLGIRINLNGTIRGFLKAFGALAFRILGASQKLSMPSPLHDHHLPAFLARDIAYLFNFGFFFAD
jgi:hypothetical protein